MLANAIVMSCAVGGTSVHPSSASKSSWSGSGAKITAMRDSGHAKSTMMPSEPISSPAVGSDTPCAARSSSSPGSSGVASEEPRFSTTVGHGVWVMSIVPTLCVGSAGLSSRGCVPRITVWSGGRRSMRALLSASHWCHACEKSGLLTASSSRTTQTSVAGRGLLARSRVRMLKGPF